MADDQCKQDIAGFSGPLYGAGEVSLVGSCPVEELRPVGVIDQGVIIEL
jgi:hypothetical protein